LGETGGDALSMTMNLGYALSSIVFFTFFLVALATQHPFLYWLVIVATPTVLMAVLGLWRFSVGSVSVNQIVSRKAEGFYWATILFSNTLGTALGDFFADDSGLGYEGAAIFFAALLTLLAVAYFRTTTSRTWLFWSTFILTRPLGATLGDLLTKPYASGGLNLDRISSSLVIAIFIAGCILFTSQSAGHHAGERLQ
jgi:uncharacterized membrane-anchored protein